MSAVLFLGTVKAQGDTVKVKETTVIEYDTIKKAPTPPVAKDTVVMQAPPVIAPAPEPACAPEDTSFASANCRTAG